MASQPHRDVDRGDLAVSDRLGQLTASLQEVHGVVAGDTRGWSATVAAADLATARAAPWSRWWPRRGVCELPTDPLVRVEVVREDVRDAELERPGLPRARLRPRSRRHPGGGNQRVHQPAAAHPDFPTPLAAGKLWARSAIDAFAEQWARRPAAPPGSRPQRLSLGRENRAPRTAAHQGAKPARELHPTGGWPTPPRELSTTPTAAS